jgi:hypothetical protein
MSKIPSQTFSVRNPYVIYINPQFQFLHFHTINFLFHIHFPGLTILPKYLLILNVFTLTFQFISTNFARTFKKTLNPIQQHGTI